MLGDTVWLTILVILGVSILLMILNRRTSDRCLKDFNGFLTTLLNKNNKRLWGRLRVYATGLEFVYKDEHHDEEGHIETSSILYKQEFTNMWMLIRFHDELTEKNQERRLRQLKRSFHPKLLPRLGRSIRNLMVNLKDALTDITGAVITAVSSSSPTGKVLSGQQSKLTKAQSELVGYAGTAYDPILERHIGRRVVAEVASPSGEVIEYVGVLKEYSGDFLELMALKYRDGERVRDCDVIVPRSISFVRHSNESTRAVKKLLDEAAS